MQNFLARHGTDVTGVISGFDRVRLRGSLRHFYQPTFIFRHLCNVGVLLKDFGAYVTSLSDRVLLGSDPTATLQSEVSTSTHPTLSLSHFNCETILFLHRSNGAEDLERLLKGLLWLAKAMLRCLPTMTHRSNLRVRHTR